MQSHREENELPALARVGSCELHVTDGSFETGFKKTNWKINVFLKAIHRLISSKERYVSERDWVDKNFQNDNDCFFDLISKREFLLVPVFLKTHQCYNYVSLLTRKKDSHYSQL